VEHCERSVYARRIHQRNVTEQELQRQVTQRMRMMHHAELRCERKVPFKGGERTEWFRIGKHGLIDIPAGVDDLSGSVAARVGILPELRGEALGENAGRGRSFALVSSETLMLSGPELRLAAVLGCERTYAAEDAGGVLVRTARYLWETATTRGGEPAPKRRAAAADALHRLLDKLCLVGEIGAWTRLDEGEVVPETRYELRPPQWWRDQVIHRVPPALRAVTAGVPRTGLELKRWREGRGWTQRDAAKKLGVGQATLSRAEGAGTAALGELMLEKVRAHLTT
jgi:hypothetical protein